MSVHKYTNTYVNCLFALSLNNIKNTDGETDKRKTHRHTLTDRDRDGQTESDRERKGGLTSHPVFAVA